MRDFGCGVGWVCAGEDAADADDGEDDDAIQDLSVVRGMSITNYEGRVGLHR